MNKIKIIVIVGPTATGKTNLAIKIAEKINSEIISADSAQVYKEFSICTAKPSVDQLCRVKHHLIGHITISENYNVMKFVSESKYLINKISNLNKVPILVGGTGLYIDALINNFQFEIDNKNYYNLESKQDMFNKLKVLDPIGAKNIDKNDYRRINRAINFFEKFGFSISSQKSNTLNANSKYEILKIGLNFRDRSLLYESINKRVDLMFKNGLIEEVNNIRKYKISRNAASIIGYKELLPYFENKLKLEESVETIKRETRRYAKRQITWFKRCIFTDWKFCDEYYCKSIENSIFEKIYDLNFEKQV
ncbi:MAG: tRNA (adenosine(37)-N6)-dimethylallyltransferase MiaA [Firmicutes bacterium]|nr:tRNA (adenosine(37)-N6)-dimethylallyltransferase MiaA [Bacillota bacterium]